MHRQKNNNNPNDFIVEWNLRYPFDYWWRKKYGVSFGSAQHREMSHIDMFLDFEEEAYYKRIMEEAKEREFEEDLPMLNKEKKKEVKLSKKEIDKEFADLNLDDYNEPVPAT